MIIVAFTKSQPERTGTTLRNFRLVRQRQQYLQNPGRKAVKSIMSSHKVRVMTSFTSAQHVTTGNRAGSVTGIPVYTHSIRRHSTAACRGSATGSEVVSLFTSPPCFNRSFTHSVCPSWAAKYNGVAPSSAGQFTNVVWPESHKHCRRGVRNVTNFWRSVLNLAC